MSADMGDNKGQHQEGDGQGGESREEDIGQTRVATRQFSTGETVVEQQDGHEMQPVVQAVLRGVDRQLESMTADFSNSMAQMSARIIAKLSKDINDAFSELMDEDNKTRESIGQVNSRVDQQEQQQAANMKRVASEIEQLADAVEDVQDEQRTQATLLERMEHRLQLCEKRMESAPVRQKEGPSGLKMDMRPGRAAPTLSPVGGEYAQSQGVRWSTPVGQNEFPVQQPQPEGSFDRYFSQRPVRREMKIGYGEQNDFPGMMNYGDGWGRGLQQGQDRGMQVGPGRDVYRGDGQFQWRERAGYRGENDDGVLGRGYGHQRGGWNNDDGLLDKQWTELKKSRSSRRENSLSGSVQRNKTQVSLFSS